MSTPILSGKLCKCNLARYRFWWNATIPASGVIRKIHCINQKTLLQGCITYIGVIKLSGKLTWCYRGFVVWEGNLRIHTQRQHSLKRGRSVWQMVGNVPSYQVASGTRSQPVVQDRLRDSVVAARPDIYCRPTRGSLGIPVSQSSIWRGAAPSASYPLRILILTPIMQHSASHTIRPRIIFQPVPIPSTHFQTNENTVNVNKAMCCVYVWLNIAQLTYPVHRGQFLSTLLYLFFNNNVAWTCTWLLFDHL